MSFNANALKINNSYDSEEPSSGSGSSLSWQLDMAEDDASNLMFSEVREQALLPARQEYKSKIIKSLQGWVNQQINSSSTASTAYEIEPDCEPIQAYRSTRHASATSNANKPIKKRKLRATAAPTATTTLAQLQHGSQCTNFMAFSDGIAKNSTVFNFAKPNKATSTTTSTITSAQDKTNHQQSGVLSSPAKNVYHNFYDTVLCDNSCNAMDIQLSNATATTTTKTKDNAFTAFRSCASSTACDLSFNGKIQTKPIIERSSFSSSLTTTTSYNCVPSPNLFDEDDNENDTAINMTDVAAADKSFSFSEMSFMNETNITATSSMADNKHHLMDNCQRDQKMLQRLRQSLNGVPPPPSKTILQIDVCDTVIANKHNILNFINNQSAAANSKQNYEDAGGLMSLLKPTHTLEETQAMPWKSILAVRQHGLCYNLVKASETREYLSLALIDRYVGNETASTYKSQQSPSSAKKRNARLKQLTQSPGNRLSHLARRRAVFSSATMCNATQKLNNLLSHQVVVDKKKTRNGRKMNTPKRRTPASKKKARKTPSSSMRKRLQRVEQLKPAPSRETSKRALFQSPNKQQMPVKPNFTPEIANRVEKSKRALFSPENNDSSCSSILKRKRSDAQLDDDFSCLQNSNSSKLFCVNSEKRFTPRALNIKSQTFCAGAGYSVNAAVNSNASSSQFSMLPKPLASSSQTAKAAKLMRAQSEQIAMPQAALSDSQRKKLLWAVSQALQEKKINNTHESFRTYAAALARLVKRIFQEFYQKNSSQVSTSETMQRLARKYVYHVMKGRNVEDLFAHAKKQIELKKAEASSRLKGYIGPEEYKNLQASQKRWQLEKQHSCNSLLNLSASENSLTSAMYSSLSQLNCTMSSQHSFLSECTQTTGSASKLPIQPNASLQNSSSKSNLGDLALRENVDCELRRSAQKNFSGKNQSNISPYAAVAVSSSASKKPAYLTETKLHNNSVKRQISFDF